MAERSIPQKRSSEARAVTPWTSWAVDAAIRERQPEKTKQSVAAKWQLAAAFCELRTDKTLAAATLRLWQRWLIVTEGREGRENTKCIYLK